ncbi:phosphatidylinositol-binding clathrin assembly protein-like [Neovison vison]|uniref:phosphatidylinositol-binding clathrin assembly protein-like n=1 Tax=Neovison vison TaxID=452646 RepID=UPI001CEFEB3D|nr:phosphatidylinositol-binding clathrin assembly protein-like [Neogale vison]
MGSSASKAALGATTDEPMEPKAKHLADLIQYINGTNMSVDHLADVLSEKTGNSSWVVVFKALVTVHHLMVHGNERFIQHLASRNSLFTLHNFLDKSVIEGYTMSTFIRRYSRYLNEKSLAYRLIASDITKTKRGTDGTMRTMDTKQLLNTLPVIQTQFDALLNFNANPDELTNGIIHAAFMLLFKDSLRLFAAYNEGILNLLDKYFDMRKNQCKESLDIYIKFLERTAKLAQFLKVAEQVGIDRNDIPYLTQAPHSLLEALKQHLASLEEKNDSLPPYRLDVEWPQPSETEIAGGMKWQLNTYTCTSTLWRHISIPPVPHMQARDPLRVKPHVRPPPRACGSSRRQLSVCSLSAAARPCPARATRRSPGTWVLASPL